MSTLVLVAGGGLSWLLRILFIVLVPARRLPTRARAVLEDAAPAALAALVATTIAAGEGAGALTRPSPMLGALLVSGLVAWRTRRLGATVVAGIAALWLLELLRPPPRHVIVRGFAAPGATKPSRSWCGVRGAGCGVRGAGCGVRGAGCA